MITNNGERNPNLQKQYDSIKTTPKTTTKKTTGNKTSTVNKTTTAKVTGSSSTSGTLTTVKEQPKKSSNSSRSSSSSSSSSSERTKTKKKTLSQAEKSAALNDLMDRATIGSSKTYGLSFQSSANKTYNQRRQSLLEQATKNGYAVGQNTRTAQNFRNTVNQKLGSAILSGKSPSEARSAEQQRLKKSAAAQKSVLRDQEKGRNRTVSELDRQIKAIDSELAPLKNKIEGRYPVISEKSGKTKEALTEERSKLIRKKKDVTGDYGVLDSIYNSLEAGAGQFNSGVTSTLHTVTKKGADVLRAIESFTNGGVTWDDFKNSGWDFDKLKFYKGDSPATDSLFQTIEDVDSSTKATTA